MNYELIKALKPFDYNRIARLWSIILDKDIQPKEVALCVHQFYVSGLLDNPDDLETIIPMTENLFRYEALSQEIIETV